MKLASTMFLSFPKSGRTWVRYFLASYMKNTTGADLKLDLPGLDISFTHNYFDVKQDEGGRPYVVDENEILTRRLILMVRDPRDVLVSYYYQKLKREEIPTMSMADFAMSDIYGIERQSVFVNELLNVFARHHDSLFLRYEALRADDTYYFRRLLAFLKIDENLHALEASCRDARFERMQQVEIDISVNGQTKVFNERLGTTPWDGDYDGLKVRRGAVGGFRYEMDAETRAVAEGSPSTARLLERLGYQ